MPTPTFVYWNSRKNPPITIAPSTTVAMLTCKIFTSPIVTRLRPHGVSMPPGGLCQMVVVIGSTSKNRPMVIRMMAKIG